jgi:hypothetical protein
MTGQIQAMDPVKPTSAQMVNVECERLLTEEIGMTTGLRLNL